MLTYFKYTGSLNIGDIKMKIMTSTEENIAYQIHQAIKQFDKSIIDDLHFEILNDFYYKNAIFSYVIKSKSTNIKNIEFYLTLFGIKKYFIDKSSPIQKQYLIVWKEK